MLTQLVTAIGEFTTALRLHYGPGPHPDGSPQQVHGGGQLGFDFDAPAQPTPVAPPEPLRYVAPHKTVVLEDPKQLITQNGVPVIDGGMATINGKSTRYAVRYDNKPDLAAQVAKWQAAWQAHADWKAAEFARNVPGVKELEAAQDAAYNEQARYDAEFERMMRSEGGRGPRPVNDEIARKADVLTATYPRAALYLRAKGYTYASNMDKYSAGKKAMELIANGGDLAAAQEILKNWLPATAQWN